MRKFISKNKGAIIFYCLLVLITLAVTNNVTIQKISANETGIQLADRK